MIDKIFMKRRRDRVFNGRFYPVGGESCAQSLPESLDASAIISRVAEQLSESGLYGHAGSRDLSESGLFPVMSVGMRFLRRFLYGAISGREQNGR